MYVYVCLRVYMYICIHISWLTRALLRDIPSWIEKQSHCMVGCFKSASICHIMSSLSGSACKALPQASDFGHVKLTSAERSINTTGNVSNFTNTTTSSQGRGRCRWWCSPRRRFVSSGVDPWPECSKMIRNERVWLHFWTCSTFKWVQMGGGKEFINHHEPSQRRNDLLEWVKH